LKTPLLRVSSGGRFADIAGIMRIAVRNRKPYLVMILRVAKAGSSRRSFQKVVLDSPFGHIGII
jgi:hypothetical protein